MAATVEKAAEVRARRHIVANAPAFNPVMVLVPVTKAEVEVNEKQEKGIEKEKKCKRSDKSDKCYRDRSSCESGDTYPSDDEA